MLFRSEEMKRHPNYKTGENYVYLGLPANFLIFDEYVAFTDMLGKESTKVIDKLKQIVMLGQQARFLSVLKTTCYAGGSKKLPAWYKKILLK